MIFGYLVRLIWRSEDYTKGMSVLHFMLIISIYLMFMNQRDIQPCSDAGSVSSSRPSI